MGRKIGIILVYALILLVLALSAAAFCFVFKISEKYAGAVGGDCPGYTSVLKLGQPKYLSGYARNHHSGKHSAGVNTGIRFLLNGTVIAESVKYTSCDCWLYTDWIYGNADEVQVCGQGHGGKSWSEVSEWTVLGKQINVSGSVQMGEGEKEVGLVRDYFYPLSGKAFVESSINQDVMVWVGDISEYSQKESSNLDDSVYACVDTNQNSICDNNEPVQMDCKNRGGNWYKGKCCGTEYPGCQFTTDVNAYCGKTDSTTFKWAPAGNIGEVHSLAGCTVGDVLGNGTALFSCGGTPSTGIQPFGFIKRVVFGLNKSHSFMCTGGKIVECAPYSGACSANSQPLGFAIKPPEGNSATYYCSSDGDWTTDLDIKDNESCEAAGFSWTGSRCCSEADDPQEYYNDPSPNATGGCWDKQFIRSGDFAMPGRILNYNGKFFGCRLNIINDAVPLNLKDYHLKDTLVNNSITPCGMVLMDAQPGGMPHAKCQPNGQWMFTDEPGGVINKSIKWTGPAGPGISESGCCAPDQCWNGTKCQKLGTYYRLGEEGFICKMLPPTSTPEPPTSEICHHNNDCPTGQYCTDQECISGSLPNTCNTNNNCPSGYHCQQHECVEE